MASMPQDPPKWWKAVDTALKFFIATELKIEEAKIRVSEGVRDFAEGAPNFTTTALEHLARPLRPLLRLDNRSTSHTFLLAPGCDVISPSCIVRQCDTTDDLRAVMTIAAGPNAFDPTTSYVNVDAWSFPVFYVYNPSYFDNYTRGVGGNDDDILRATGKTPPLGGDPVFRYPASPSADKALALLNLPAGPMKSDIIPVGVLAFIYVFVLYCVLCHFGMLPLGRCVVKKYKKYARAIPIERAAQEKAEGNTKAEESCTRRRHHTRRRRSSREE